MTTKTQATVRVVIWAGTTQETHEVSTYAAAMRLVSRRHANAHSPTYYEISTGRELYDDGIGLCYEDRSCYVV